MSVCMDAGKVASCAATYAEAMHELLSLPAHEFQQLQASARASVARFSGETETERWSECEGDYLRKLV